MLTVDNFAEALGNSVSKDRYAQLFTAGNRALIACGCSTVNRAAGWFAQIGHESVGLKYMRELWGPTPDQLTYQGRMGNDQPGDGRRYLGRGPLQVTGKDNYRALSRWAHAANLVPTPTFFVDEPEQLEGDRYGFIGVVWYWTVAQPKLNEYCDRGDIENVSKLVNAPAWVGRPDKHANGIADRIRRWDTARAMGDRILPAPPEPPTLEVPDLDVYTAIARQFV